MVISEVKHSYSLAEGVLCHIHQDRQMLDEETNQSSSKELYLWEKISVHRLHYKNGSVS